MPIEIKTFKFRQGVWVHVYFSFPV